MKKILIQLDDEMYEKIVDETRFLPWQIPIMVDIIFDAIIDGEIVSDNETDKN